MKHAEFMYKVGRLKRSPDSWKDMFFPEAHDLTEPGTEPREVGANPYSLMDRAKWGR